MGIIANNVVNNVNDTLSLTCAPNHGFLRCVTEQTRPQNKAFQLLARLLAQAIEHNRKGRIFAVRVVRARIIGTVPPALTLATAIRFKRLSIELGGSLRLVRAPRAIDDAL